MAEEISRFKGKYGFLSNYYDAKVTYNRLTYLNTEAAFHAQKDPTRAKEFTRLIPSMSKKLGRQVNLRPDWEKVKDRIMYEIVKAKFEQNPDLREKLLATGDATLIEGNTWNDRYWGVCNGQGKNRLGQILMRVRSELSM